MTHDPREPTIPSFKMRHVDIVSYRLILFRQR
jgi:hypothetical protein